jgi:hypothetical protein
MFKELNAKPKLTSICGFINLEELKGKYENRKRVSILSVDSEYLSHPIDAGSCID